VRNRQLCLKTSLTGYGLANGELLLSVPRFAFRDLATGVSGGIWTFFHSSTGINPRHFHFGLSATLQGFVQKSLEDPEPEPIDHNVWGDTRGLCILGTHLKLSNQLPVLYFSSVDSECPG
jgi:hypothetical protein